MFEMLVIGSSLSSTRCVFEKVDWLERQGACRRRLWADRQIRWRKRERHFRCTAISPVRRRSIGSSMATVSSKISVRKGLLAVPPRANNDPDSPHSEKLPPAFKPTAINYNKSILK